MDFKEFEDGMKYHLSKMEEIVGQMPDKSGTSIDSQKITLKIALDAVDRCINGTEPIDLMEHDE